MGSTSQLTSFTEIHSPFIEIVVHYRYERTVKKELVKLISSSTEVKCHIPEDMGCFYFGQSFHIPRFPIISTENEDECAQCENCVCFGVIVS